MLTDTLSWGNTVGSEQLLSELMYHIKVRFIMIMYLSILYILHRFFANTSGTTDPLKS